MLDFVSAVQDLLLENDKDPFGRAQFDGSLGYSHPEMVEFNILRCKQHDSDSGLQERRLWGTGRQMDLQGQPSQSFRVATVSKYIWLFKQDVS